MIVSSEVRGTEVQKRKGDRGSLEHVEGLFVEGEVQVVVENEGEGQIGGMIADEVFDVLPQGASNAEGLVLVAVDNREGVDSLALAGKEVIDSEVRLAEMDFALDLCEVQPLQNMDYLKAREVTGSLFVFGGGNEGVCWAEVGEVYLQDKTPGRKELEDEFPPLNRENVRSGKNKEFLQPPLQQGKGGQRDLGQKSGAARAGGQPLHLQSGFTPPGFQNGFSSEGTKGGYGVGQKQSMADILKAGEKNPIIF